MSPLGYALLGLALAVALYFGVRRAGEEAVRRFFRPAARPPRPLPEALAPLAEDVTIPGPRVPFKAWLLRPEGGARGVAVFVPGWSSDGGRMARLAEPVLARGIACLLLDLPGHGRSQPVPHYNAVFMIEDLRAARDWIEGREDLSLLPAAIVGYSFGGLGAIVSLGRDPRWSAAATLAAPVGPLPAIEYYFRQRGLPGGILSRTLRGSIARVAGVDPDTLDARRHLREIDRPVLVIHGAADEVVPVSNAEALLGSAPPGRASLLVVERAGHDALRSHPEAGGRLAEFLSGVAVFTSGTAV